MSNVHLQTAAKNLRRAINDVQNEIQQNKSANDQRVQSLQKRLNDIKQEEAQLSALAASADSDQVRASHTSRIQDLEREVSEINKDIMKLNDDFRKIEQELERQKSEYSRLATMLEAAD